MKVLVIIPAKLDSTRLAKKNIQLLHNKTLIEHSIDYAKKSKHNPTIVVSSESNIVHEIAINNNVICVTRPSHLLKDAEVTDVYIDYCRNISEQYDDKRSYFVIVYLSRSLGGFDRGKCVYLNLTVQKCISMIQMRIHGFQRRMGSTVML